MDYLACPVRNKMRAAWSALPRTLNYPGSDTAKHGQNGQLAFLRYAHRCVEDLHLGTGWETEFPRDVWELRRIGVDGNRPGNMAAVRFCPNSAKT